MNTQVELLMLDMNKLCETITIDTMGARRGGGGGVGASVGRCPLEKSLKQCRIKF